MSNKYLKKSVQNISPYSWEPSTDDLAKELKLARNKIIRLDYNTPGQPPACYDEFLKIISKNREVNEYQDYSYDDLKKLIADYESIKKEQIVCGNSGDEMIDIIGKACLNQNDKFIISSPTYSVYKIQCQINGGLAIDVPLTSFFDLDESEIIKQAKRKKVKLIFICNPNNPTATISDPKKILKIIKNVNCLVVIDEAYGEFYGKSFKKYIKQYYNLIILKSFSKFARIASARVGYILTNQQLAKKLDALRFPMGIPYFSMELAKLVLKRDQKDRQKNIQQTISERERMKKILAANNIITTNSKANFLLIILPKNYKKTIEKLKKIGLIVRDRGSQVPNAIRVTVRDKKTNDFFLKNLLKSI